MLSTTTAADITQNYMNITLDLCALKHEDFIVPDGGKQTSLHQIIQLKVVFF